MLPRLLTRLACVAFLALAPLATQARPAPSLLPDGSFENLDRVTERPAGWPGGRGVSWPLENGNRHLRLSSTGPGVMNTLHLQIRLPTGIEALEHTYRARVSGLKRGENSWYDARVIINFKNAHGENLRSAPPSFHLANTDGWINRTHRFLVPDGAVFLEYMPSLFRVESGTFDLDNISLHPIDPAPLRAEIARNTAPPPPPLEQPKPENFPPELFVVGNRLRDKEGNEVWLQGVNIASLEWKHQGDNMLRSTITAINGWKSNVIRLPMKDTYWFGQGEGQTDGGQAYRKLIDNLITLVANRGAYLILDLHHYRAPKQEHIAFWTDAATRYKNHPAVLFDLLNEAHSTSWAVWRNGGYVAERRARADEDNFFTDEERIAARLGFQSPGMQRMLEVVRETGARNVIVAGGLDYAYDLSGILKGYALEEKGGNGIMYASHIYPWKSDWQGKMLDIAALHPILIGEVGADNRPQPWENPANFVQPETWVPDMLGLIQKHRLNWTGWCFHPHAGPRMLADWQYTPTPYWGAYAKRALAGEQFPPPSRLR